MAKFESVIGSRLMKTTSNMFIPEFSKTDKESIQFFLLMIDIFLNNESIKMVWNPADPNNSSYQKYVTKLYWELERIYNNDKDLDKFIMLLVMYLLMKVTFQYKN